MNWPQTQLKHVADVRVSNVDKKSKDAERPVRLCNYVDVYKNDVVDGSLDFMRATATAEQVRAFALRAGDTIITKDSETAQDIAVAAYVSETLPDLVCGYHLAVIRPGREVDPRFLYWTLRSQPVREQAAIAATGVTRFGLRQDGIKNVTMHLPDLADQRRVANFLDKETARIDRLLALLGRRLSLLAAWRASALSATLTEAGARASRLKYLLRRSICYGVLVPAFVPSGGVPLIRVSNLDDLDGAAPTLVQIEHSQAMEYRRTLVKSGDLLIAVVGATAGKAAIVPVVAEGFNVSRAVARVQLLEDLDPFLVWCWTQSSEFLRQVALATSSATAQPLLNVGDLSNFAVTLPNDAGSRARAVARAREVESRHRRLSRSTLAQISLLKERREAVTAAAVTGQLDVATARGVA